MSVFGHSIYDALNCITGVWENKAAHNQGETSTGLAQQYVDVNNNPMASPGPIGTDGNGKGGDKVIPVLMSSAVDERGRGANATNGKDVAAKGIQMPVLLCGRS